MGWNHQLVKFRIQIGEVFPKHFLVVTKTLDQESTGER